MSQTTDNGKFNMEDASALFKIKYEKLSENIYNSANILLGRCKKSYNFVGSQLEIAVPQSFAGGVGSGKLPAASKAKYGKAIIQAKSLYARVTIDRQTIKASLKDEGSFVRATKEVVKKGVESYMRNLSRILFSDGSGKLATCVNPAVAVYDSTEDETTITLTSMKEANLEEGDLVNFDSETVQHEIKAVDPSNSKIVVSGDASSKCANDASIYMQNSKDNDPQGLAKALKKFDSTISPAEKLYNIDKDRRWSASVVEASSASVSTDLLNKVMLKVEKKCGKAPNLLVCSYTQFEKILNILEDQKRYQVNTRAGIKSKSGADISFSGVEFMSTSGPVGIFPERFADEDKVYALNDNHIHIHHRPDFGWFDDDGTVFLRQADLDGYEARYGGYLEIYINPAFQGVIEGLAV